MSKTEMADRYKMLECACDILTLLQSLEDDLGESESPMTIKARNFKEKLSKEIETSILELVGEHELEKCLDLERLTEAAPEEHLDDEYVPPDRVKRHRHYSAEQWATRIGFTDPNIASLIKYNFSFALALLERSYKLYRKQPGIADDEVKLYRLRLIYSSLQLQLILADMDSTLSGK